MEKNQEIIFAKCLEELRGMAKLQRNMVTEEQIQDTFAELKLSEEQFLLVKEYLKGAKIGIGEAPEEIELSQEDVNYLQMYLDELELLPEFSDGEKRAYTMAAMNGEREAINKVVSMYLKNVVDIAKLYSGQGVLLEDLIGEGNVTLAYGATMLDSQEKPEDCEAMLIQMVMNAMEELVQETSGQEDIYAKAVKNVNSINDKAMAMAEELGRKITVEELMAEEKLSRKSILDAVRISGFQIDALELSDEDIKELAASGNEGDGGTVKMRP